MIKYSRGRNIHRHWLYLLRETRTRIAPWTSGCVCAFSGIPSFLSFPFLSLHRFRHGNNKRWRRTTRCSVYYLVGWFFSRHRSSLSFLVSLPLPFSCYTSSFVTCLFFSFSSIEPVRRQTTEKRSRPSNRKKRCKLFLRLLLLRLRVFVLQVTECFFLFFSIERVGSTHNILFAFFIRVVSSEICFSRSLFYFTCACL